PQNKLVDRLSVDTVNSANLLSSSQDTFKRGGTATEFYTAGFPPTSTATLPRTIFDDQGVLSFYKVATPLSSTQLQSVQNLYAGDLTSRKNYSVNIANIAKNLTSLSSSGLNSGLQNKVNSAINSLRTAYNTLSDVNAPAPDPRALYAQVAIAYSALNSSCDLNQAQKNMGKIGIGMLEIGASNYDTNRLPVAGTPITPAPQTPPTGAQAMAAGFPLTNFDNVRNTPLSAAQANPTQTFGASVTSYLNSIGLTGCDFDINKVDMQVNSANNLQSIEVPLGNGRSLTAFFNTGFPVPVGTAPQVAFKGTTGVRQYLDVASNPPQTQQKLTTYYANPANAARRTNLGVNYTNLTAAFTQLKQAGSLSPAAANQVNDALATLAAAQQQLATPGGLPDVLGVYQKLGDNLDRLASTCGFNQTQKELFQTLSGSLLPIGVQNYYLVPVSLVQTA
ncbi:MAG: hypothetical protein FD167_4469, partial [bacterium]